jgi:hypothetical protein
LHPSSLAAAAVIATVASVSGCQPKQGSEHECDCICYKETGKIINMVAQKVATTKECGNVNGTACTGDVGGGQIFEGQLANCGPNPNVARAFFDAVSSAIGAKASSESGSGGGHGGGTGMNRPAGHSQ